jgi:hypothetical protein
LFRENDGVVKLEMVKYEVKGEVQKLEFKDWFIRKLHLPNFMWRVALPIENWIRKITNKPVKITPIKYTLEEPIIGYYNKEHLNEMLTDIIDNEIVTKVKITKSKTIIEIEHSGLIQKPSQKMVDKFTKKEVK